MSNAHSNIVSDFAPGNTSDLTQTPKSNTSFPSAPIIAPSSSFNRKPEEKPQSHAPLPNRGRNFTGVHANAYQDALEFAKFGVASIKVRYTILLFIDRKKMC